MQSGFVLELLLVDDEINVRKLLKRALLGCLPVLETILELNVDAAKALQRCRQVGFDIVIATIACRG